MTEGQMEALAEVFRYIVRGSIPALTRDVSIIREKRYVLRQIADPGISLRRKRNSLLSNHVLIPRLLRPYYLNSALHLSIKTLDFLVLPQAAGYMDLKRSTLRVKVRLTDSNDKPISKDENVALVNLPQHSLFTQVDCSLQQTGVGQTGTNYAYKAYIDTLLSSSANDKVELDSQLFVKDSSGRRDEPNVRNGSNTGSYLRSQYTDDGRILELEAPIHLDIFRQNRLIINGVSLSLKFHQSKNVFRLMSDVENASYKTQIVDASFKLCVQKPNAGVSMAHIKLLEDETAIYPHRSSRFKIASVSKGEYSHNQNNLFEGEIPSQLIVGLVSSAAYEGDYKKSSFFFKLSTVIFWPCTLMDNRIPQNFFNPILPKRTAWKPTER